MPTRVETTTGVVFTEMGEGPAVVMLHGIGGAAESCIDAGEAIAARGFRVLCWDAPGYGVSADPLGPVDHVATLRQALDELDVAEAVIVGTSWGGVIATRLALEQPERVSALVLADSTRGSAVSPERAAAMRGRVLELEAVGAESFAERRASRLVSPHAVPAVTEAVRRCMARVRVPGYRAAAEFMASNDTGPLLSAITVPTLVIVGADDVITGVSESELLADRIPGARLEVIPAAGHAAITENPEGFARLVLDLLEQL